MGDGFGSCRGWTHIVNVNSFPFVKQKYSNDNKSYLTRLFYSFNPLCHVTIEFFVFGLDIDFAMQSLMRIIVDTICKFVRKIIKQFSAGSKKFTSYAFSLSSSVVYSCRASGQFVMFTVHVIHSFILAPITHLSLSNRLDAKKCFDDDDDDDEDDKDDDDYVTLTSFDKIAFMLQWWTSDELKLFTEIERK
ncbi:hypothetical protein AGLY_003148 [Aphis glycines]|uniref:Uncharacterized protein n=1 Tax=Aphis glycines TaxID=307491 RepID=A0A6G0U2Q3_APHGL|nr:hypothetical protein AGLY_003148 [Aphis glycines]